MSTTDQSTQQGLMHGADILVKSLVDHNVDSHVRVPGRHQHADPPGTDALLGQDPHDPPPPRARRGVRGSRLRTLNGQAGRLHGNQRSGGDEPGHGYR